MSGSSLAGRVLDRLAEAGVRDIVVCPGGRNAAFVQALAAEDRFHCWCHFEERSAAYFALGIAKASGRPAAVIVTSGTAAGELLPAAMEAHYAGVRLILVTADRPRRFRGSGAPQSAEQKGLFGACCRQSVDVADDEPMPALARSAGPTHVNVCLEDPKGAEATGLHPMAGSLSLRSFLKESWRPLVIAGGMSKADAEEAKHFLLTLGAPVWCESQSHLREDSDLKSLRVTVADGIFDRAKGVGDPIDGVLRLGSVPTHRIWRDLEDRHRSLPVLSISRLPFTGLGRTSSLELWDDVHWPSRGDANAPGRLLAADRDAQARLQLLLDKFPRSEAAMMRRLSQVIGGSAFVFLGNSLPIREWDLAADFTTGAGRTYAANRGLNGIDGLVSTFLGMCSAEEAGNGENWAILGDLSTLYDGPGLWAIPEMAAGVEWTIAVINNFGGQIFASMFPEPEFQNRHQLDFASWARHWGVDHRLAESPVDIVPAGGRRLLEIRPDAAQTEAFVQEWRASLP